MNRRCLIFTLLCLPLGAQPTLASGHKGFDLKRAEIVSFVDEVVERDQLKRKTVLALLAKAKPQPKILEIISRPAEKVSPWWQYRERFLTPRRINEGAQFWSEHRESVERISADSGIPPEYLVAILGVETHYGRLTGRYRVLDVLATLAFDYPPRGDYFRGELEQFILLTQEDKLDPLKTTGSYAGAMGAPQFMPSSYRRYAVSAAAEGKKDLWTDWDDILASVANYLREHGWQTGSPVLAEARVDADPAISLEARKIELNETVSSLGARGIRIELPVPGDTPATLISAEQRDGPAYRVGFQNFYVITRYNNSARYAMSVHDLAQAIAQRVHGTAP